ncbi:hypothetical protein GS506_25430 [Rhodococcus hoagii]|nr:hypothetical protein [Prescottella equi]
MTSVRTVGKRSSSTAGSAAILRKSGESTSGGDRSSGRTGPNARKERA